jgi:hypothetical protein
VVNSVEIGFIISSQDDTTEHHEEDHADIMRNGSSEGLVWQQQPHMSFGACYTITFEDWIRELGVSFVSLT